MKKKSLIGLISVIMLLAASSQASAIDVGQNTQITAASLPSTERSFLNERSKLFRFFNTQTNSHFFTIDENEKIFIESSYDWYVLEGVAYYAFKSYNQPSDASPVYRFYNSLTGSYFYTIDEAEKNTIITDYDWLEPEGIAWYAYGPGAGRPSDAKPVYRFFNQDTGCHFYTIDESEKDAVIADFRWYRFEGIAWYAFTTPTPVSVSSQWHGASTVDRTEMGFTISGENVTQIQLILDMKHHPPLTQLVIDLDTPVPITKDGFAISGSVDIDEYPMPIEYKFSAYYRDRQWFVFYEYDQTGYSWLPYWFREKLSATEVAADFEPGDQHAFSIGTEDIPYLHSAIYEAKMVEDLPGVDHDAVMLLPMEEINHNDMLYPPGENDFVALPLETVQAFLEMHWDAYWGGAADEGMDAWALNALLAELHLDIQVFLKWAHELDYDLNCLVTALKTIMTLNTADSTDLSNFNIFLSVLQMPISEFLDTLDLAGFSLEGLLQYLNKQTIDFLGLYDLLVKDADTDTVLGFFQKIAGTSANNQTTRAFLRQKQSVDPVKLVGLGLDIAKFSWTIIKDNKAELTTEAIKTHVLNKSAPDPLAYNFGDSQTLPQFEFTHTVPPFVGLIPFSAAFLTPICSFNAKHPTISGSYLPNIMFRPGTMRVGWPFQLNMQAIISNVENRGTAASPDPYIEISIVITYGNVFVQMQKAFSYTVSAINGMSPLGEPKIALNHFWE